MRRGLIGNSQVVGRVSASDPFGRFKPESHHVVRKPDVTGQSLAERVKRTREMLRSMTPEQVKQVIEFHKDLNLFQALELAQREGKLIVPNDIHDRILMETSNEQYFRENYPIWTGTLLLHEKPDKPFDKKVNFGWKDDNNLKYSISFQVPKQFRGKTNCALIVEHPAFELIHLGNNRYEIKAEDANIRLIENFPTKSQTLYNTNSETKIPQGESVSHQSKEARYLWRLDGAYIGFVVRAGYFYVRRGGDNRRRDVFASVVWSVVSGVAFVSLGSPVSSSEAKKE